MAKAINEGLRTAMVENNKVMVMGEDIAQLGGVFRVTEGLQEQFGPNRVVDTPLAESGIVGTAIGLAMRGYRPVCEIQFDGFVYPAFDQIVTQLAKQTARHEGTQSFPVVIRIPYGGHIGAVEHHQESPEAYFAHTAGPAGHFAGEPQRRFLDDSTGHRQRRPGDFPGAQEPLLAQSPR
jgi:pyruvate dehydrogenase E1 component beta subunit